MKNHQPHYDLEERLIDFACNVIDIDDELPNNRVGNLPRGTNQLLRSGTAPASHYGEAQSAESRNDFVHKMKVALKELRESSVWLKIVKRRSLIATMDKVDSALKESDELIRIFVKSISTAESRKA
jgi:four helix bundle protein